MRKTRGKDKDFRKALVANLIKNLIKYRKITTTLVRGKKLKNLVPKMTGGVVRMVRLSERRGDGVLRVLLTYENKNNKTKTDKKKVASG